jgi:hypothetical protein
MGLFSKVTGGKRVQRIPAEALGVFDATGGGATDLIAADTAALGHLFRDVRVGTSEPPSCTALLIYCRFGRQGEIVGHSQDLGEVIATAAAPIVIVASPHTGARYDTVSRHSSWTASNLVLTLDRHGDAFPRFLERLFTLMVGGMSMPRAWSKIAPQGPTHDEGPDLIFDCALGQIALEPLA